MTRAYCRLADCQTPARGGDCPPDCECGGAIFDRRSSRLLSSIAFVAALISALALAWPQTNPPYLVRVVNGLLIETARGLW